MLSACESCSHYEMCKGTACNAEKRHIIDAVVTVNITEHQALKSPICMLHGNTRKGEFPENIKAAVQYGENLQALSVALNTVGAVSIQRTHETLSGVFNIPIATGTIINMVKRCTDSVTDTVHVIRQKMLESGPSHFDETGTRVDKKLWWGHDASNNDYTYLNISTKRGVAGMEQCDVLPHFHGVVMHDCWTSYWNYHKFDKQYDKLIKQAREESPLLETTAKKRGRKKKGKILALVERLDNYKASVCLFIKTSKFRLTITRQNATSG